MYIYVDGVMQGNRGTIPQGLNNTTTPVSIGSKRTGNDPNYDGAFNGTIDEVSIYPYAMDAATVLAHYGAAYGTSLAPFINVQPSPPPITSAWWRSSRWWPPGQFRSPISGRETAWICLIYKPQAVLISQDLRQRT